MPSNHTYFQMSNLLHADKKKDGINGERKRQALFVYCVSNLHSARTSDMDCSLQGHSIWQY